MISHWWRQTLTRKARTFRRAPSFRPMLELLEDRWVPATITVNTLDDSIAKDDFLTLREAIELANGDLDIDSLSDKEKAQVNGTPGLFIHDKIQFDLTGTGPHIITLTSELPNIFDEIEIDGANNNGGNVEIDGQNVTGNGLTLTSARSSDASGSFIHGLVIRDFQGNGDATGHGILIDNGISGVRIEGNFIGTDATGQVSRGNAGHGILIQGSNNTIGGVGGVGLGEGRGNLISGNGQDGVQITSSGNQVLGNFIGVALDGKDGLGNGGHGVSIKSFSGGNTIGGPSTLTSGGLAGSGNLISGNGGHGVLIESLSGSGGNGVQGNFIGTDITGAAKNLGNGGSGVRILNSSANFIGIKPLDDEGKVTNTGAEFVGNVISGNTDDGIFIEGSGAQNNLVQGNFIGLAVNGDTKLGNGRHGVYLYEGASSNTIGGDSAEEGNVISGNTKDGVLIKAFGVSGPPKPIPTTGNVLRNNFIGTGSTGTSPVGNGRNGVTITNGEAVGSNGANFNTIGGALGQGNTIAFNDGTGVLVGVSKDDKVVNNSILANSIFANGKLGIDLGRDGPTAPNDSGDDDDGPNFFQNFPTLIGIVQSGNDLVISYSIASFAFAPVLGAFRIEFFASDVPDPSGFGQGRLFWVSVDIPWTNSKLSITIVNGASLSFRFFTATATFLENIDNILIPRSTSEFSNVVFIPLVPTVVTTPGGDPIVVRILQSGVEPIVPPVAEAALQEIVVRGLPPLPPTRLLAPLPVERFQPLVDAPGEIHGQILDDPHALGKPGPDTFPLHGQPVYIDFNRNGEFDDGEPITVTNGKGEYTFTSLTAGQYTVHLLLGRTQDVTFSPKQDNKIELRSGNMIVTNVNFGVRFRARRGPGGRSSLPGVVDGLRLADTSVLPTAAESGSLEALPLPQEAPALPVAVEPVPLADADDSILSDLLRWGTWLLGAAVVVPWRQLAARRRK